MWLSQPVFPIFAHLDDPILQSAMHPASLEILMVFSHTTILRAFGVLFSCFTSRVDSSPASILLMFQIYHLICLLKTSLLAHVTFPDLTTIISLFTLSAFVHGLGGEASYPVGAAKSSLWQFSVQIRPLIALTVKAFNVPRSASPFPDQSPQTRAGSPHKRSMRCQHTRSAL